MSSSQRGKRRRGDDDDDDLEIDEKPFQNHPTLYFDDGNIILRTVFRDLFQQKHETFRGLSQIDMTDTREDLEALLNVVYDGLRVDVEELTVETFPMVATVLRMATKYKIERPCKDIIASIREQWPSSLTQHDARDRIPTAAMPVHDKAPALGLAHHNEDIQQPAAGPSRHRNAPPPPRAPNPHEDLIVHPASVINLLRSCAHTSRSLLFPLFYALSCTTWQFGGPALGHHLAPLPLADMERLVVGIERLRAKHAALAVCMPPFEPVKTTIPPHFCLAGAAQLWGYLTSALLGSGSASHDPLEEWKEMTRLVWAQHIRYGVCGECAKEVVGQIEANRRYLWDLLPRYFEL